MGDNTFSYVYDCVGNFSVINDFKNNTISHIAWDDALGRRTEDDDHTCCGGGISTYDAAGNRITYGWVDGTFTATYTRDLLGRVTAITENAGQADAFTLASYSYDNFGRLSAIAYTGTAYTLAQGFTYGSDDRLAVTGYGFSNTSYNLYSSLTYNGADEISVTQRPWRPRCAG